MNLGSQQQRAMHNVELLYHDARALCRSHTARPQGTLLTPVWCFPTGLAFSPSHLTMGGRVGDRGCGRCSSCACIYVCTISAADARSAPPLTRGVRAPGRQKKIKEPTTQATNDWSSRTNEYWSSVGHRLWLCLVDPPARPVVCRGRAQFVVRSWAPSPIRKNSLQQHHPVWWLIIEKASLRPVPPAAIRNPANPDIQRTILQQHDRPRRPATVRPANSHGAVGSTGTTRRAPLSLSCGGSAAAAVAARRIKGP